VYVDRLPARQYHSIGIIEVAGPANMMDLGTVMNEARSAGAKAGCDVVVDKTIHQVSHSLGGPGPRTLVQYHPLYSPAPVYAQPQDRRQFVCGVYRTSADELLPT
jgi:hypothetical protein